MFIALRYLVTRAPGDGQAVLGEFLDEFVVAMRMMLVFVIDDFLQLDSHGIPGDLFAAGADGAADEESFEREDAARGLHPFIVDGPADGRDMHAHLVGDLLHLQRLDEFGAFARETRFDDRRWLGPRASACCGAARSIRSAIGPS